MCNRLCGWAGLKYAGVCFCVCVCMFAGVCMCARVDFTQKCACVLVREWVSKCVHGWGFTYVGMCGHLFIIFSFFNLSLNKHRMNCSANFAVTSVTMTLKNSDSDSNSYGWGGSLDLKQVSGSFSCVREYWNVLWNTKLHLTFNQWEQEEILTIF